MSRLPKKKPGNPARFLRSFSPPRSPTPITPAYLYGNTERSTETDRLFRQTNEKLTAPFSESVHNQRWPRNTMTPYIRSCRHISMVPRTLRNVAHFAYLAAKLTGKSTEKCWIRFRCAFGFYMKTDRNPGWVNPDGDRRETNIWCHKIFDFNPTGTWYDIPLSECEIITLKTHTSIIMFALQQHVVHVPFRLESIQPQRRQTENCKYAELHSFYRKQLIGNTLPINRGHLYYW